MNEPDAFVSFLTQPGDNYQIEHTTNLMNPFWLTWGW
jgi:hypothetical protein